MNERLNPYVGPRAFETGETLYGRERDLRQLRSLLVAERLVLLHSPSGAGKTSLIQAGLIPSLTKTFNMLPVVRVNLEPPKEALTMAEFNRYTFSVLAALEEVRPPEERLPAADLATLSLDSYIEQRLPPGDLVLIFDQFEEILTVSPTDRETRAEFFTGLGLALRNPDRWALFSMREDFIGALAPYLRPIPGQLENRYRLDVLGPDAAKQAIQKPAQSNGVDFNDETARKLLDDLRVIQVQQPDGSFERVLGQEIEPVQLQVVCYRLWEALPKDATQIAPEDVQKVGSVDDALSGYYSESLHRASESSGVEERAIRQWFNEQLITPDSIRSQVLRGYEATAGLPNRVLGQLENMHLIRGETRAGKTWYELSHDRLLGPVQQSNANWFEKNLSLLQKQAALWNQQGRSDGLLLHGKTLTDSEKNVDTTRLTPEEKAFLEACRAFRKLRMITFSLWVALLLLAGIVGMFSYQPLKNEFLRGQAITQMGEPYLFGKEAVELGNKAWRNADDNRSYYYPLQMYLISAFSIDANLVTDEIYSLCASAGACSKPLSYQWNSKSKQPVIYITPLQAIQFCNWIGRRLPTDKEWELFARTHKASEIYEWTSTSFEYDKPDATMEWNNLEVAPPDRLTVRGGITSKMTPAEYLMQVTTRISQPSNFFDGTTGFRCAKNR